MKHTVVSKKMWHWGESVLNRNGDTTKQFEFNGQ